MTNPLDDLDEVLNWWTKEAPTGKHLALLRREIAQSGSRRRRASVEECALNLLSTTEEQISDRSTGGRTARMTGFSRLYAGLETPLRHLLWNFAIADSIALHYQRPQAHASAWIATFVALASAGFWVFNHNTELMRHFPFSAAGIESLLPIGILLIVLFTVLSFHSRLRFRQLRHRYLTARSLAEALRVDFFQRLTGTGFDTLEVFAAHHETTQDRSITYKALEAALSRFNATPQSPPQETPSPDPRRIQIAEDYWIESQHRYFGKPKVDHSIAGAAGREAEAARSLEKRLSVCFVLTGIAVVTTLILFMAPPVVEFASAKGFLHLDKSRIENWSEIPRLFTDLLTPILGIAAAFLHQRSAAHAVTAQKYRRAALVLSEARHHLSAPDLTPAFRLSTLRYVAYQAVAETADWGVHQREQSKHIAFR